MTSIHAVTPATTTATSSAPSAGSMLLGGAVATVAAAVATPLVALAGHAAGISLNLAGAPIPPAGFAVLTLMFSIVGLVVATALRRFARRPRIAWIRTTMTLTVLSFVPDALVDAAVTTKALLMLTHVVAAAIVVPAVARRLR